jgi:hypothetical protein
MRLLLLLAFASQLFAAPLEIIRPLLSNTDGGEVNPADFPYSPGETIFFSCRVHNYQKTAEEKVHLTWSIRTLDSKGVPIDVSYVVSVLDSSGKVLWTQPEPTTAQSESFYPRLWVPASMSVTTQKNTQPGQYGIAIQVKDAIGNQTYETKAPFSIE